MSVIRIEEIKKLLPHRYPFLLVDRVLEVDENYIKTLKNVSSNEEFFNGHFPGRALMPGVLQVEALAQSACIMLMKMHVKDPDNNLIVFSAIKNAKFRRSVVPGDQLMMESSILADKRGVMKFECQAFVDGDLACTSAITCMEREI